MGRLNFYALWSLRDAPRPFSSKSNRGCFQVHVPLPLPSQLVIFGLGAWTCSRMTISVEVLVSAEVPAQRIGTLTSQVRCLTWEGDWDSDIVTAAAHRGRRGVYGKILLTMCGQPQETLRVLSSTPSRQRKSLFPEQENATRLSSTMLQSTVNEPVRSADLKLTAFKWSRVVNAFIVKSLQVTPSFSHLGESMCSAEIQVNKSNTSENAVECKPAVWPTSSGLICHALCKDKTPRRTVIGKRGHLTWSSEDMDGLSGDTDQASTPKKRRLSRLNSQEAMAVHIKTEDREVSVCPSKRWSHAMCLSDPDTAILVGGETEQGRCKDFLWKLELDNDFWFPIHSSAPEPEPLCARGHTATYDPDSKTVFVYGGLRAGQHSSELYILNTLTWKWRLVTAKGNVPNLTYHSAAFYKKELFVFGGVQPSHSSREETCRNALYIFNPEFELWYQPIVEGDRPLPRFGHSATLLSHKMIIFGGRKTATYLNDVHVLDLGFMEYTAVKCGNMPPLPRGFHAALPVSDNRVLISGGCSAIGALRDVHVFNIDTNMWTSVESPVLCLKPRAGHSMINLGCVALTDTEKHGRRGKEKLQCTLLVFGGSDCCGSFYGDTIKCKVEIPCDK